MVSEQWMQRTILKFMSLSFSWSTLAGGGGSTHPATDESEEGRSSPPATKKIRRQINGSCLLVQNSNSPSPHVLYYCDDSSSWGEPEQAAN